MKKSGKTPVRAPPDLRYCTKTLPARKSASLGVRATSIAASQAFADRILRNEPGAVDTYLAMLKAGGSDHPYELVKRAGVDLATPAPYRALVARMNSIMDQIESILAKGKQ